MGEMLKNKKINSWLGIFFQIPVFLIAAFGLYKLAEIFFYSCTKYNMLEEPSFIGLENYSNVFKNEVVQKCLGNTVVMAFGVTALLVLTAVLPAIFTARLKLPFGLGVMGAFFMISICAMLPNVFNTFFSGDSYGILNSWLLSMSIITEPIIFIPSYAKLLAIIAMWLYCLAPVFSITYIAARKKHSFLGAAIAVCAIPVLMYSGGGIVIGIAGYPSADYSADWFYTIFNNYLMIRFDVGFAYAILVIGLIMLIGWCLLACAVVFGLWAICKKVDSGSLVFKVAGYITFALSLQLFITVSIFIIIYLLKAFMPLDELFAVPNSIIPKSPTLENFSGLAKLMSNTFVPFDAYLFNSMIAIPLVIMPFCLSVVLPSGVGFGAFRVFKQQKLLLLCFIPFLFVSSYMTLRNFEMLDSHFAYLFDFISSFELLIAVFLVYLTTTLVFYGRKPRISDILLGSFFVLSSFYAISAIKGIWSTGNGAIYNEKLKTWMALSANISASGIARSGIAAANDMLMLLATIAVLAVPSILLLLLYLSYRKNIKNRNRTFAG